MRSAAAASSSNIIARLLPRVLATTAILTTTASKQTSIPLPPRRLVSQTTRKKMSSTTAFTLQQGKISDSSFAILKDLLQTADPNSPRSAVEHAAAAATQELKKTNDKQAINDGYMFQFWRDVFGAAEQAPGTDHPALDRLVLFVRELSLKGDIGVKVWDKRVWTDLPVLGAALREQLDGPAQVRDPAEQDKKNAGWVNFNAFAARLMAADVLDLSTQALWLLRDALEEDLQTRGGPKEASREILTAAAWVEYAGPILFEKILWSPEPKSLSDEDKRTLRAGPLYKGGPGLSSDRWLFWKKRFEELAAGNGTAAEGDEAKKAAARAARLMEVWIETRMRLPQ